ncbi:MAG: hypothetical protein ABFD12_10165 [Syntrophorhabdus sp.]
MTGRGKWARQYEGDGTRQMGEAARGNETMQYDDETMHCRNYGTM